MTDRELLEKAARAVGITLDFSVRGDFPPYYINDRGGHSSWNPLEDDGEALRLAVKLNMRVSGGQVDWMGTELVAQFIDYKDGDHHDEMRATRRAIVQAAALADQS